MGTVLIIDDDDGVRSTLCALVNSYTPYMASEATNGAEGLAYLNEDIGLILCDHHMPIMDGPTFLRTIHGDARYAPYTHIPIIGMTATNSYPTIAGLAATFTKPFDMQEVIELIAKHYTPTR